MTGNDKSQGQSKFFTCKFLALIISFILVFILYFCYTFLIPNFSDLVKLKIHLNVSVPIITFNIEGFDVLVYLHIQKTGGTLLEKSLTRDGVLLKNCSCIRKVKRCNCLNHYGINWLFSRYSTGWKCGLHADWTELHECIPNYVTREASKVGLTKKRRAFYITMLRNPQDRYISEWKHVQRGATWWSSRYICNGQSPTLSELPTCYSSDMDWSGVSISQFIKCPSNLAHNRMTRMLANLTLVGCYKKGGAWAPSKKSASILLDSAKQNLEFGLIHFGVLEWIGVSQYLLHRATNDGVILNEILLPINISHSKKAKLNLTKDVLHSINKVNSLDWELYNFAVKLLFRRMMWFLGNKEKDRIFHCCKSDLWLELKWNRIDQLDLNYALAYPNLFERVARRLILLDGSKYPSHKLLMKRKRKWYKKLNREI